MSIYNSSLSLIPFEYNSELLPYLTLIAVLVGLFICGIVWWYLRDSIQSKELMELLESVDEVDILMHPDPDPDCMGSAMGVQVLAESVNTSANIVYSGDITHHENRAFRAVLDVSFTQIDSADELHDTVILVDHAAPRGFDNCTDVKPDAIIDHHDTTYIGDAEYAHIEPDIGSCSTLVTEYLSEQGLSFEKERVNPDIKSTVANGLYYGIRTDTSGFLGMNVNTRDFKAAKKLYTLVDTNKLFQIANPKIDIETFEIKSHAFYAKDVRSSLAVSNVGEVSNSDSIPYSAEELSQLEGISAVVVIGICDGIVRFSGRTYDARIHMGKVLKEVTDTFDSGSAGGHSTMGGGQISMDALESEDSSIADLKEIVFDKMKGY